MWTVLSYHVCFHAPMSSLIGWLFAGITTSINLNLHQPPQPLYHNHLSKTKWKGRAKQGHRRDLCLSPNLQYLSPSGPSDSLRRPNLSNFDEISLIFSAYFLPYCVVGVYAVELFLSLVLLRTWRPFLSATCLGWRQSAHRLHHQSQTFLDFWYGDALCFLLFLFSL